MVEGAVPLNSDSLDTLEEEKRRRAQLTKSAHHKGDKVVFGDLWVRPSLGAFEPGEKAGVAILRDVRRGGWVRDLDVNESSRLPVTEDDVEICAAAISAAVIAHKTLCLIDKANRAGHFTEKGCNSVVSLNATAGLYLAGTIKRVKVG